AGLYARDLLGIAAVTRHRLAGGVTGLRLRLEGQRLLNHRRVLHDAPEVTERQDRQEGAPDLETGGRSGLGNDGRTVIAVHRIDAVPAREETAGMEPARSNGAHDHREEGGCATTTDYSAADADENRHDHAADGGHDVFLLERRAILLDVPARKLRATEVGTTAGATPDDERQGEDRQQVLKHEPEAVVGCQEH